MATYRYTALDENGKKATNTIDINSPEELYKYVQQNNQVLVSYKEVKNEKRSKKINYRDIADFCRQLGTLQSSGISLVRALNIITRSESLKPWQKEIYNDIMVSIKKGNSLSTAMEERKGAFPELLINMYKTAEISGNLEKTSMQMCEYYEKQYILNKKITTSLVYPCIIILLVVGVVIFLVSYIIPQLQPVLETLSELPLPTRMLLGLSNAFAEHWIIILIVTVLLIVAIIFLLRIPKVRIKYDRLKIHIPYFGKLFKTIYTARFSRTIASLYASGLPIVSALSVGSRTVGNKYVEEQFEWVIIQVRSGRALSEVLYQVDGFVNKLSDTTLIGEETGNLADMLVATADSLEYEADVAITKMVTSLEPILIIIMGIIVGFVMVSILLPVYQSYSAVGAQGGI